MYQKVKEVTGTAQPLTVKLVKTRVESEKERVHENDKRDLSRETERDIYICFIAYEKAFERVNHEKLIEKLKLAGMDGMDWCAGKSPVGQKPRDFGS